MGEEHDCRLMEMRVRVNVRFGCDRSESTDPIIAQSYYERARAASATPYELPRRRCA